MANKKITELPAATVPLNAGDILEIVQGGINKQVAKSDVATGGGGTVTSVTGTASRITSSGGATPVIDIDTAYDAAVQAIADAKVADAINDGTTGIAPSQNAVFDALALKADKHPAANRQTGSYTLVLTDDGKMVEMNVASANNLTIPPNSSVAFPVNTFVTLVQYGAGLTTVIAGAGVTIRTSSGILTSPGQYSPMVIQKIATDEWYLWNGVPTPVSYGTYTPTLTNVSNVSASTAYLCNYLRVGNTVTVSGRFDIDPTTTTTSTLLGISLPVSSIFTTANQCGGTAAATAIAGQVAAIRSDAAQARAEVIYNCVDVTNQPMYFTFTYQVL